jgi:hypothetical protein
MRGLHAAGRKSAFRLWEELRRAGTSEKTKPQDLGGDGAEGEGFTERFGAESTEGRHSEQPHSRGRV